MLSESHLGTFSNAKLGIMVRTNRCPARELRGHCEARDVDIDSFVRTQSVIGKSEVLTPN